MMLEQDQSVIAGMLAQVTAAWRSGAFEALAPLLHEHMVIAAPGVLEERVIGRDACIEVYRDFYDAASITAFEEETPFIAVWGHTAVASRTWAMTWDDAEGPHAATGQDVYALSRLEGEWRIVGRMLLETTRA